MIVRHSPRPHHVARAAFTLMELLVVVAILVVLAGVGGVIYMKYLDDAKISAAKLQVKNLSEAAEAYKIKHGDYPASLDTLTQPDDDGQGKPYLDRDALTTPWGGTYQYEAAGQNNKYKPDIWADAPGGGRIGNWSGR